MPVRPAAGVHRGYDMLEFSPQECGRDFPRAAARRMRVRMVDEEQALLRRVAAEFSANTSVRERADETSEAEKPAGDGASRLYRD
ncbi:hypothetical protein [Xanthobacter sediminis]